MTRPPIYRRLNHHTLERYENIWLGIAAVMSVLLFISVAASFFSGTYAAISDQNGHHITGVENGRYDPAKLSATPFSTPGVRKNADGSYEAFVIASAKQGFRFIPPTLEVPVGKPITIHLTSEDVMHGYFIEGTNINATAIPGQVASFTTTFNRPGTLNVVCNEYCGTGHHNMVNKVIVKPMD